MGITWTVRVWGATDNGAALNPARRGWEGQLAVYATSLGVEAITGKPYKSTTQGKNERFHQTLFRFLDTQPIADTLAELQEQVDRFDRIYNTQRSHQGLPGRATPQQARDAIPVAEPPRPRLPASRPILVEPAAGAPGTPFPNENITTRRVKSSGAIDIRRVTYQIARELAGHTIYVAKQAEGVKFYDSNGDLLLEHPWPAPGTKHVSNGRPRGSGSKRPENIRDVIRRMSTDVPPDEYRRFVRADGRVSIRGVVYGIGKTRAGRPVHAVIDAETVVFCDPVTCEIIAEHPIPEPDTKQPDIAVTTASCPYSNRAIPDHEVSGMS